MSVSASACDPRGSVEVFEDVLRRFGTARLKVQGTSMLPAIYPGDEVLIQSCGCNECTVNDVVAFRREGRLFIHRVVECHNDRVVTQGDTHVVADGPVTSDEFLGKVTAVQRDGANVNTASSVVQRAASAVFRYSRTCASVFQKYASL